VLAGAAPEQQAQMLPIIEQGIASVAAKDRQRIRPLLLRGKLLRIRGKVIEAIQTLEQARELVDKDPASSDHRMARWEIYDLLARCYIDSHQDGSAQKLLESLVAELPNYGPARILLTQILIHGRDLDAARKNLDVLEKSKPNDPAVLKLRLQVLDPATQRAQIAEVYGRLPEREKAEAMDKVNSAMAVGEKEDAIRLVERLRREYPHDLAVTVLAVKVYHSQHEPYRARELAQEGLADHPGNLQLKVELEALDREAGR
jgi:predicted Zn-dependent protease